MRHSHRRDLVIGSAAAGLFLLAHGDGMAQAQEGARVIPWTDQPPPVPPPLASVARNLTSWENLDSWITPTDRFFEVGHYGWPEIDPASWQLAIEGHVDAPDRLSLAELKARPRQEVTFTLECSGNHGLPFLVSAIGNARWAGTSLAEVLRQAGIRDGAKEVVFFGADRSEEVLRAGTPIELRFETNFARSMSVEDAMNPANMLCYEMNGQTLPSAHGAPVRLVAPGWYGIANVKWLQRIVVSETRFLNRFMARDYVTVRERRQGDQTMISETSVGPQLLKSAPARVLSAAGSHRIEGMAWGPTPIAAVEVRIDDGPWMRAALVGEDGGAFAWRFWRLDWQAQPGEHRITSRAIDTEGHVQPAMDDPVIAGKRTYWESNGQVTRAVRIG
ncbi:sulfite oxidase [Roseomonas terrae]|uniref:Sulfite oxidase n=2 Tax=Neoroseomonas terrae TaxID=424799 RepID=A0ABS5EQB6_9PROT|nr:sulfite oxidase [Neoroseomonas terrae]